MREPDNRSRSARGHLAAIACLILVLGVRGGENPAGGRRAPLPLAGVKFRLLVVDDPALATAAKRLSGEWHAQTGSDFDIIQGSEKDLAAAKTLDADAVICSSAMIGTLAAGKSNCCPSRKTPSRRRRAMVRHLCPVATPRGSLG